MAATAFVIQSWSASTQPNSDGEYVHISGRAGGLIAWLLNVLGISPTIHLIVRTDKIIFRKGSLEGTFNFITPLENTCSTFYTFKRPLKEAIILGIILGVATYFSFGLIGIAIAFLYYLLNKTLTVGFTDIGGRISEIPFKRSVIEGKTLDESQASHVCDVIQTLVDERRALTRITV